MRRLRLGALAAALLVFAACADQADDRPRQTVVRFPQSRPARTAWLPGWEAPGRAFRKVAPDRFEQSRGSEIRFSFVAPEGALLKGHARLREGHHERKFERPVRGRAIVTLVDGDGADHTLIEIGYEAPGDTLSFTLSHDLGAFAGQLVTLVLRLEAGRADPDLAQIHQRLRMIWTDLRVEGFNDPAR